MNMHARINVQVGKFSKTNNCADCNKDVQAGIFLEINKLCSTIIRETRVPVYLLIFKVRLILFNCNYENLDFTNIDQSQKSKLSISEEECTKSSIVNRKVEKFKIATVMLRIFSVRRYGDFV